MAPPKAAIEAYCLAFDTLSMTNPLMRPIYDALKLEFAGILKMKPGGRAREYLENFLVPKEKQKVFSTSILLGEDHRVAKKIYSTIRQALAKNPGLGKQRGPKMAYQIPISQSDYSVEDWQLALGSFDFYWEPFPNFTDRGIRTVRIYGENWYKWSPKADRVTQCLHEAGERLETTFISKRFLMIATSAILDLTTSKFHDQEAGS